MNTLNVKKHFLLLTAIAASLVLFTACGSGGNQGQSQNSGNASQSNPVQSTSAGEEKNDVTTLRVAYRRADAPWDYEDENGNPAGGLCELFEIVDEYLPDYQFEYFPADNDGLYLGLETGDYDIGVLSAAYSTVRAENYVFPTEYYGGSKLVLVVRSEDADVDTIEEVASRGMKIPPVGPTNGITFALQQWNEYHPDNQLELIYRDETAQTVSDYQDVLNGTVDAAFSLQAFWDSLVEAEDGTFHDVRDDLSCHLVLAMKTYPLLSKETVGADEQFVAELSEAIRKAKADPRAVEISEKYYGDNFLEYPYGEGW